MAAGSPTTGRLSVLLVSVADFVLILLAVGTGALARLGPAGVFSEPDLLLRGFIVAAVMQAGLSLAGFYDFSMRLSPGQLLQRLLVGLAFSVTSTWALYYLFPPVVLGRGIFSASQVLGCFGLLGWRLIVQRVSPGLFRMRLMLMGSGELAREICSVIAAGRQRGLEAVGFLAGTFGAPVQRAQLEEELGTPFLGTFEEVLDVARRENIDVVVVASDERRGALPMMDLLECHFAGIEVIDGVTFYEKQTQKVYVRRLNPSWLIFGDGFRLAPLTIASKRLLDVVGAAVGLVVALPVILLFGLLVKATSRGSMVYSQVRMGQHGRPFVIHKLRSMRDAGAQGNDGRASSATDPATWNPETARITGIGAFMRRMHVDEHPQLWNVFRGDMSLVGPRPERPEFIARLEKDIPFYQQRHIVKPGITGLAQIKYDYGASVEGSLEKLQYDLSYIRNLGVISDLLIILKTIQVVFFGREERQ